MTITTLLVCSIFSSPTLCIPLSLFKVKASKLGCAAAAASHPTPTDAIANCGIDVRALSRRNVSLMTVTHGTYTSIAASRTKSSNFAHDERREITSLWLVQQQDNRWEKRREMREMCISGEWTRCAWSLMMKIESTGQFPVSPSRRIALLITMVITSIAQRVMMAFLRKICAW